ncbi:hypothetical protein OHA77_20770 [Streptosporangium sp. NBC_01639]|uniref:hypothetical protein n=1 Tax=Streptosporangium sp. NBC_01639 TaxID=2975948 RepID=UPI00386E0D2F|nr:hypothetical protein OHA77_20770 [Streptosporangium sp. NBC_01639]
MTQRRSAIRLLAKAVIVFLLIWTRGRENRHRTRPTVTQPPPAASSPGPHGGRRRPRPIRLWGNPRLAGAVVITAVSAYLAATGWMAFQESTPPIPSNGYNGAVMLVIPEGIEHVDLHVNGYFVYIPDGEKQQKLDQFPVPGQESLMVSVFLTMSLPKGMNCAYSKFLLSGDAVVQDDIDLSTSQKLVQSAKYSVVFQKSCSDNRLGNRPVQDFFTYRAKRSMVSVEGYRAAVRTPEVSIVQGPAEALKPSPTMPAVALGGLAGEAPEGWTAKKSILLSSNEVEVKSGTPETVDRYLQWTDEGRDMPILGFDAAANRATVTYLPGEAEATRRLFIAGALLGLVGGLIAWAGQLVLDSLFRRREDDPPHSRGPYPQHGEPGAQRALEPDPPSRRV